MWQSQTPRPPEFQTKMANRGTGAGGAATTKNGSAFETLTWNGDRLLTAGFTKIKLGKIHYCLRKEIDNDREIIFLSQWALRTYCKLNLDKIIDRRPDEAYLFRNGDKYLLKILEKKAQNGSGSVEDKLGLAAWMKREYKWSLGPQFTVEYAFCVDNWLKNKITTGNGKFAPWRHLHAEEGTTVLFGEDPDYFTKLDDWISTSFV